MSRPERRREKKQRKLRKAKQKAVAQQRKQQEAAARLAAIRNLTPPALSPATLKALMDTGAAKVSNEGNGRGVLEIDPNTAWEVDPWI